MLAKWYDDYVNDGDLKKTVYHRPKFTAGQRTADKFYLDHGKSMNLTKPVLGYPGCTTLSRRSSEDCPLKRVFKGGTPTIFLS